MYYGFLMPPVAGFAAGLDEPVADFAATTPGLLVGLAAAEANFGAPGLLVLGSIVSHPFPANDDSSAGDNVELPYGSVNRLFLTD